MKTRLTGLGLVLLLLTNPAQAGYDPFDGSSYSCNEGHTPELCRERELQTELQAQHQWAEDEAQALLSPYRVDPPARIVPTQYRIQGLEPQ